MEDTTEEDTIGYERFPNLEALIQVHNELLRQRSMPELTATKSRTPGRGARVLERASSWADRFTSLAPFTSVSAMRTARRRQSEPGAGKKR